MRDCVDNIFELKWYVDVAVLWTRQRRGEAGGVRVHAGQTQVAARGCDAEKLCLFGLEICLSVRLSNKTTKANETEEEQKKLKLGAPGKLSLGAQLAGRLYGMFLLLSPLLKALPLDCWGRRCVGSTTLRVGVRETRENAEDGRREMDPGAVSVINNDNQIPEQGKAG